MLVLKDKKKSGSANEVKSSGSARGERNSDQIKKDSPSPLEY